MPAIIQNNEIDAKSLEIKNAKLGVKVSKNPSNILTSTDEGLAVDFTNPHIHQIDPPLSREYGGLVFKRCMLGDETVWVVEDIKG